jgi:hypothetical protein
MGRLGYPDGLKGEAIPIGARILSVAASLDALASDRRYRKAVSLERAVEVMRRNPARALIRGGSDTQRRYRDLEEQVNQVRADDSPARGRGGTVPPGQRRKGSSS